MLRKLIAIERGRQSAASSSSSSSEFMLDNEGAVLMNTFPLWTSDDDDRYSSSNSEESSEFRLKDDDEDELGAVQWPESSSDGSSSAVSLPPLPPIIHGNDHHDGSASWLKDTTETVETTADDDNSTVSSFDELPVEVPSVASELPLFAPRNNAALRLRSTNEVQRVQKKKPSIEGFKSKDGRRRTSTPIPLAGGSLQLVHLPRCNSTGAMQEGLKSMSTCSNNHSASQRLL